MANNIAFANTVGPTYPSDTVLAAAGRITFPATAIVAADFTVVNLGFTPRYIQWCNVTSRVQVEWFEGMAANTCIKTAATGTRTIETTNGGITVCDTAVAAADAAAANTTGRAFKVLQNATLVAVLASEVVNWRAVG